jgi:hypothetical protein
MVDEADVVLHRMHQRTGIPDAIRRVRPELPVVVVASGPGGDLPPTAPVDSQVHALRRVVHEGYTWTPAVGRLGFSR